MFNRIINAIAGNYNDKQIQLLTPTVHAINARCDELDSRAEEQIKSRSGELKSIIQDKTKDLTEQDSIANIINEYVVEAFAIVKQACKRLIGTTYTVKGNEQIWNMIPYDVQIIGGLNLHYGKISEMKTGEGKTLVATMPAYLNALLGRGVHIVTVNDYLASRDSEQMSIVFEYLGLSVGCVTKATPLHLRREEYAKDITYIENSELGFDYLRDNLTKSLQERNVLWRPLYYAIVDEVDSILIDESRTPLIISEPDSEPTEKYTYYSQIITMLSPSRTKKKVSKGFLYDMVNDAKKDQSDQEDVGDYYVDEKTKSVSLSSEGITKLEQILNVENLYKDIGYEEIHHIENALKAQACYNEGKEYIVHNGEILIVDENTGRTQPGRRFSQGLHQAIEAKEKVTIQRESRTLATITYQNFFKIYKKLAGMTGTATTEGEEFDSIYNLHVLAIPTNREVIRTDHNDRVYFNQNAKWSHVIEHILFAHRAGQPLLIGTSSIQTSELVSSLLTKQNITHSVLNAKFHEQEANIIARAGKYGSVVVATNMAGRGTDIKLEEGLNEKIAQNYAKRLLSSDSVIGTIYSEYEYNLTIDALKSIDSNITEDMIIASYKNNQTLSGRTFKITLNTKKKFPSERFAQISITTSSSQPGVETPHYDLHYGLGIIGTEKHESRRIDNQLRGRAGRQGDPGMSVFYVGLDDTIMRKMGGEKIQSVASLLLSKNDLETLTLTQSQFTNAIVRAQKQMEGRNFGIRKHLFDYDSVIDKQRQAIYKKRDYILYILNQYINSGLSQNVDSSTLSTMIADLIEPTISRFLQNQHMLGVAGIELVDAINKEFGLNLDSNHLSDTFYHSTTNHIVGHIITKLEQAKGILGEETLNTLLAHIYLNAIDRHRVVHIDEMQYLREKVGFMGYAQLDPLVIYKKESYEKYQTLLQTIEDTTVVTIANTDFEHIRYTPSQQDNYDSIALDGSEDMGEINIVNKLKSAAQSSSGGTRIPQHTSSTQNSNDIEVIETSSHTQSSSTGPSHANKIRPNDKINVRYTDGKTLRDVKYKTVKDDIQSGKCQIL